MLQFKRSAKTDVSDQIIALQNEVSRLSRELASLKAATRISPTVSRSGCAGLADALGINERTVRKVLVSHPAFARMRESSGKVPLTRNTQFLAWLKANLDKWPS